MVGREGHDPSIPYGREIFLKALVFTSRPFLGLLFWTMP